MKKVLIINTVAVLALVCAAAGSQISDLTWNSSNAQTLRSLDKDAVLRFMNEWSGNTAAPVTSGELREFEWVDLAGDGKYELATTASFGPCCVFLGVYSQDAAGKVSFQSLEGARRLSETIRDLNGDGKDELIIWIELAQGGTWTPTAETPRWPAYVEASQDFP